MEEREKPGAQTPWADINQLLAPDERFEVQLSNWRGFLLAPKHSSQLAALFYVINKQGLEFCVQGRGTITCPQPHHLLIISARAFSQIFLHEQGTVEVGAGCSLSHLHQFLFERQRETALEENLLSSSKRSVAGMILSGQSAGIQYRQETLLETILGVELVTWEGCQIKWGGHPSSLLAGPALHKLIWGLEFIPAVIVKVILKTYPIPQTRLRLTWSFQQKEAVWKHLKSLELFSSSWEYLGCAISGTFHDHGFVFAQISGMQKEMEAFSQVCPSYSSAQQKGERIYFKNFLKQQNLRACLTSIDQSLTPGEYLWHQQLDKKTWWMTYQAIKKKSEPLPLWKQHLWDSLYPNKGNKEWMKNC